MFKSILYTFAFIGFIGATSVPVLAVNSVTENNDKAGVNLDVVANPE